MGNKVIMTTCLVQWLARLTAIQEVPGFIPCYTLEIFLEVQGLERGPPSLMRTIGQLLDMRSSKIRLRKLKLRLGDKRFANHKAPCTAISQQPLQSVLALRGCSATDFLFLISQYSFETILLSCLLSKKLNVNTLKTIILPVVLYGSETWSLTLREEHRVKGV